MSEEEKKAIEYTKLDIKITKEQLENGDLFMLEKQERERINNLKIILNLIKKQQEQLQEKDKIINLMAEQIDLFKNKMDMLRNFEEDCFIPREFSDIDDCVKRKECKDCIIEYFTKKAREV